jgi:hypothetical protein
MLTILEGDPGIGKSYLAMHLAAVKSAGLELPDGVKVPAGRVLYLTTEDDPSFTLRPRIEAMEGNVSRIRFVQEFLTFDEKGVEKLEQELEEYEHDLVVVDTLYGFVPAGTDTNKGVDIRALLTRVSKVASEHDAAVLLIRHWTKGDRGKAIYRGSGSIDIIAVARSAITIAVHPEEPGQRVIAHSKHNLSLPGISRVFRIVKHDAGQHPTLEWDGTSNLTADDLQAQIRPEPRPGDVATRFLIEELSVGPVPAKHLLSKAKTLGISDRTLDRAKKQLRITAQKRGERWIWSLPKQRTPAPPG